ncbi:hypothetical protein [Hyphomicrobium sp. D-2]|uniref:hypothetical protein n=1 Tax=Hyphomicrobium sp. D-2 TaxID=3041621 RepID=UPI00245489DE|nr:hypothetical protein [Hyphomicrobium sp. D-2]MDH4983605.1 hypothetical protein [Hyphomicrobium sp. D-2]
MSLSLQLTIRCAAVVMAFGIAGSVLAEEAGAPQGSGSNDRQMEQPAPPADGAPARRDPNVKPLIDVPAGCPYWGNDKLELIA